MTPRVSVVLPTRDRMRTLPRAVRSVLAQSFRDWELVLVDDGSTDATPAFRERLRAALGDRYAEVETGGRGAATARNEGIRHARAPLVAFLDSDDAWLPDKLGLQLAAMDRGDVTLCFTGFSTLSPAGRLLRGLHPIPAGLARTAYPSLLSPINNVVTTPSVVAPRDALLEEGFDEAMTICEDIDLWVRLARRGRVVAVRQPLTLVEDRPLPAFPYARSIEARAMLYRHAVARDPNILPHLSAWWRELLESYAAVAEARDIPLMAALLRGGAKRPPATIAEQDVRIPRLCGDLRRLSPDR